MMKKEDFDKEYEFFKLPKVFFENEKYKNLTMLEIATYVLILDRGKLSAQNGWTDDNDNVYVIFTNDELSEKLNCSVPTVVKITRELKKCGLLLVKRQGLGKPNPIYPQPFENLEVNGDKKEKKKTFSKKFFRKTETDTTVEKSEHIEKTTEVEVKETTEPVMIEPAPVTEIISEIEDRFKKNIRYYGNVVDYYGEIISETKKNMVDEILQLMIEVTITQQKTIKISKNNEVSTELFKERIST